MICGECANPCGWDAVAYHDPDPPGYAICKECVMIIEWRYVSGEWLLSAFQQSRHGGYFRQTTFILSPFGPPFKYRRWHRENRNWERWTLDHCRDIEEAKACLATAMRMQ